MKIEEAIVYLLATSGHGMKKVRRDNAPVDGKMVYARKSWKTKSIHCVGDKAVPGMGIVRLEKVFGHVFTAPPPAASTARTHISAIICQGGGCEGCGGEEATGVCEEVL